MNENISYKAFTVLELIFVIVIITALAGIALPKFFNTKALANVVVIKQDIATAISSIQTYYLLNNKINKISDAINMDDSVWLIEDKKITYKEGENNCIVIEVKNNSFSKKIDLRVYPTAGSLCLRINNSGVKNRIYELN